MDKILSKSLSLSLSGEQIMTLSNNKAKVIRYRDLSTFLSLDELLEPYFKVFVLMMMMMMMMISKKDIASDNRHEGREFSPGLATTVVALSEWGGDRIAGMSQQQ